MRRLILSLLVLTLPLAAQANIITVHFAALDSASLKAVTGRLLAEHTITSVQGDIPGHSVTLNTSGDVDNCKLRDLITPAGLTPTTVTRVPAVKQSTLCPGY
ncbi:MAG: hypothetical protein WDN72_07430 [Alphaproteobacteria bacterium]